MNVFLLATGMLACCVCARVVLYWLPDLYRTVCIMLLSRRVRNRSMVLGLWVYTGGTEGNPVNTNAVAALERINKELHLLGVKVGELHQQAAMSLSFDFFWRDRIVETAVGTATLVVVGDWRVWYPMFGPGQAHHTLRLDLYRHNGWRMDQANHAELDIDANRPAWLTRRWLAQQGLLRILRGLDETLRAPAPDTGYRYDTSAWPYEEQV